MNQTSKKKDWGLIICYACSITLICMVFTSAAVDSRKKQAHEAALELAYERGVSDGLAKAEQLLKDKVAKQCTAWWFEDGKSRHKDIQKAFCKG